MTGGNFDPQHYGAMSERVKIHDDAIAALTASVKELVKEMHEWRATFKIGKAVIGIMMFLALFAGAGIKDAATWLPKILP